MSKQASPEPSPAAYLKLKQNVTDMLDRIGMNKRIPIRNRIIERLSLVNDKDTHLIQSIIKALKKYLDN
ncbi:MAG TPA: hypothetical protein ENL22_10050 [candidate division Zixibacteria bacterium]|nr:hypothetical protein [candidate division Zixibacteria bacterium]